MARAETIESVGETGGRGGNDPLPRHHTCRMELPRPFYSCPGLLTTTAFSSETATVHRRHHNHNHLHPLQALYPLPYPHQEDQDETRNHQRPPAFSPLPPRSPLCNRREGMGGGAAAPSAFTGEQSADSHRDECRDASSRQGPLPDLLPQNELSSRASPRQRAPGGEAAQEVEVRTVASQLRTIGDEFNATVLQRAHVAPHWQEWRDACRGLLNFITQTLSTLYRLT